MSRMLVSRSYRQLYAERSALRLMIRTKENQLAFDEMHIDEFVKLERQIESDKALLKEIENDIEIFRERNRM